MVDKWGEEFNIGHRLTFIMRELKPDKGKDRDIYQIIIKEMPLVDHKPGNSRDNRWDNNLDNNPGNNPDNSPDNNIGNNLDNSPDNNLDNKPDNTIISLRIIQEIIETMIKIEEIPKIDKMFKTEIHLHPIEGKVTPLILFPILSMNNFQLWSKHYLYFSGHFNLLNNIFSNFNNYVNVNI